MIILTPQNFEQEVLNSERPCVVTFKSSGCHLCHGLTKVLFKLARMYHNNFKFASVDIGLESEISDLFEIDGVPTMFLFEDGDASEIPYPENPSIVAGYSMEYLIEYLDEVLADE